MAVPKFDELMKPLLTAVMDGEVYKITLTPSFGLNHFVLLKL